MNWDAKKSADLYGIDYWGAPYFAINEAGHIAIRPAGDGIEVDLYKLVQDLRARGLRPPILLRFPDLIRSRLQLIDNVFAKAISDYNYQGVYQGVFPIKVNQQRHLVEEITRYGTELGFGLECGSKPELLIALAYSEGSKGLIICNGFKDRDYMETALLSRKLGRNTLIVIDRYEELPVLIEVANHLRIHPRIGFRVKLNTQSEGRWVESSGAKSKFGLSPSEIVSGIDQLKQADLLSSLELLHFHIGSQIPTIQSIKSAVKEGAQFYTELHQLGADIKFLDVGGGLGVDYDGSGKGESSTNYSEQEYANDVVSIIQGICDDKNIPHPNIISESGRSLVAHSSVLIFNILGTHRVANRQLTVNRGPDDSRLVQDLFEIHNDLRLDNLNEFYNDLQEKKRDTNQMFSYGVLSLEQRAKAEDLYWAIAAKMHRLARNNPDAQEIFWALEKEQSDIFFCNFSVFQSLPDAWAVGQRFPVMPIHRLNESPDRRAVLVDLTCDSDGKIDSFNDFDDDESQDYLEVHEPNGEAYFLAAFLTGAYQETLGDLHNLFGDTDAVHIKLTEGGYQVEQVVRGDAVSDVLRYVQYGTEELKERIRRASESSIHNGQLDHHEAKLLMERYVQGLSGYTYLEKSE